MKQVDFMMLSNNIKGATVNQGTSGIVTVTLHDECIITHNYKKKDKIVIEFNEGDKYLITKRVELELIYSIHLENLEKPNVLDLIKNYCSENLTKIA